MCYAYSKAEITLLKFHHQIFPEAMKCTYYLGIQATVAFNITWRASRWQAVAVNRAQKV